MARLIWVVGRGWFTFVSRAEREKGRIIAVINLLPKGKMARDNTHKNATNTTNTKTHETEKLYAT